MTALQIPELIEKAVGVDTTGRLQTVWQVKVLENVGSDAACNIELEEWTNLIRPSGARLTTSTASIQAEPNPCLVPPSGGFQGLENQLYRVEVHLPGPAEQATFKWTRENASVASRVVAIPTPTQIVVESIGHDEALAFHPGDWVEILDDWLELHGIPEELRCIKGGGVDSTTRTLTLEAALSVDLFPVDSRGNTDAKRNTRVRRWDQSGVVRRADGTIYHDLGTSGISDGIPIPPAGTRPLVENGILVEFSLDDSGEFKTGDYWVFAARTADASIELLDRAPPRGIHHHYARLAILTFPETVHDCPILWPPLAEGAGCDCTVCVHPDTHNNGTATIQQAIEVVRNRGGGTICLDSGSYLITDSLSIEGINSIRIRGQGWGTLLLSGRTGPIFEISKGVGVSLQNLTAISSAARVPRGGAPVAANNTAVIEVMNTVDFSLEHVNAFCISTGQTPGASAALALFGYLIGANVRDCALVATHGVTAGIDEDSYCLTAGFRMTGSLLLCQQKGVSFDGLSFHYGDLRLADNLFLGCSEAGIELTGGALPGSLVLVEDNVLKLKLTDEGIAIRGGLDGLRVIGNEIPALDVSADDDVLERVGERPRIETSHGDGIVIDGGLDPRGMDNLQIVGNRIQNLGGHGIVIRRSVAHCMIKSNVVKNVAGSGLVTEPDGSADYLAIENNHFLELGPTGETHSYGAVLLFQVKRVDFVGNVLDGIALTASSSVLLAGVLIFACDEVRIAGNRLDNIGPIDFTGMTAGIACLAPCLNPESVI